MHHIGKTALANSHRDEYERVMSTVYNEGRSLTDVEHEVFGFSHAELDAAVVQQWGLPEGLVLTIQHHHNPGKLAELDEEVARICALTTVTSLCLSKLGVGRSKLLDSLDIGAQAAWAFLNLTAEDVDPILNACSDRIKESQTVTGWAFTGRCEHSTTIQPPPRGAIVESREGSRISARIRGCGSFLRVHVAPDREVNSSSRDEFNTTTPVQSFVIANPKPRFVDRIEGEHHGTRRSRETRNHRIDHRE
jgi:hypothetical protein